MLNFKYIALFATLNCNLVEKTRHSFYFRPGFSTRNKTNEKRSVLMQEHQKILKFSLSFCFEN